MRAASPAIVVAAFRAVHSSEVNRSMSRGAVERARSLTWTFFEKGEYSGVKIGYSG